MTELKPLSFAEFQRFLSDALMVPEEVLAPDISLLNDLAVDSLKLVELILQFEVQMGVSIPSEAAWEIQTVGDAYRYYREHFQDQAQGDTAAGESYAYG